MKTVELTQGSPEWSAHRRNHFNASDAPAMMGASKYATRAQLIERTVTGITPDIDERTQRLFDRGHEVEAMSRPMAEAIVGDDLYPATATSDEHPHLSASFDGVTMDESIIWECKLWNDKLAESVRSGTVPETHVWQLEHQLLVSWAEKCLFMVTDGETEVHCWYVSDPDRRSALLAGWEQFGKDCESWVPEAPKDVVVATPTESLPAVSVRMDGQIAVISNLDLFGQQLHAFVGAVNTEPNDDQGFADAEAAVKTLKKAEEALTQAEAQALAQIDPVEAMRRQVADLHETARSTRLLLEKVVKTRKEQIKSNAVQAGIEAVRAAYAEHNKGLGRHAISIPASLTTDIGGAIKGLKTIDSVKDAVATAVAHAKIAASEHAAKVSANVAILREHDQHAHLFADAVSICESKSPDDLRNLIATRINEHKVREQARIDAERARIRAEEEARAQREADAKARQESEDRRRMEAHASAERSAGTVESMARSEEPPAYNAGPDARLKLGDINALIYPLSISADGLAHFGFEPVAQVKAAKFYRATDLPKILARLQRHLSGALLEKAA